MKLLELHERTNPLTKASFSCKHLINFVYCVYFFGRVIEALTAHLGAVGLASPTLVGEGLSNEDDSN